MDFKIETITPKKAEQYLSTNYENQRHLNQNCILQLADYMDSGEFDGLNGDTIKFKKNGKGWVLVDGQHRLNAVSLYGKPVKMCVLRGVSTDGFITLDQGQKRNVVHYYQINNILHPMLSSQVGKWLFYKNFGGNPLKWRGKGKTPIPGKVAEWAIENRSDVAEILDRVIPFLNEFQKIGAGQKTHLAYAYYLWAKIDPIEAYAVCEFFATGTGDVSQVLHSARNYMLMKSADQQTMPGTKRAHQVISLLNIAWNMRNNNRIRKFSGIKAVKDVEKLLSKVTQGADYAPIAAVK